MAAPPPFFLSSARFHRNLSYVCSCFVHVKAFEHMRLHTLARTHACTHARMHARTHARTHTHRHTLCLCLSLPLSVSLCLSVSLSLSLSLSLVNGVPNIPQTPLPHFCFHHSLWRFRLFMIMVLAVFPRETTNARSCWFALNGG